MANTQFDEYMMILDQLSKDSDLRQKFQAWCNSLCNDPVCEGVCTSNLISDLNSESLPIMFKTYLKDAAFHSRYTESLVSETYLFTKFESTGEGI